MNRERSTPVTQVRLVAYSSGVPSGTWLRKIDPTPAPAEAYLSGLGITGYTAYFGLLDVGKPAAGETVVVSSAAGAVGSIVCQIAKQRGCRVVGLAGGPVKRQFPLDELRVDAALQLVTQSARMQGFTLLDYLPRILEAFGQHWQWWRNAQLRLREHLRDSIEQFPRAFAMLFTGENHGKLLLCLSSPGLIQ